MRSGDHDVAIFTVALAVCACQPSHGDGDESTESGSTSALSDDGQRARTLLEILEESYTLAGVPGRGHVDKVGPAARVVSEPLH